MPDPKLKAAAEEIKAMLKKYNIAGSVALSSPTHIEYLRWLETDWLALKLVEVDGRQAVHFRCKRADYATQEEQTQAMRNTIGTLLGFLDTFRVDIEAYTRLLAEVGRRVQFTHVSRDERS